MISFKIKNRKYGEFKVLVDNEDFKLVSEFTWYIERQKGNKFRVSTRIKNKIVRIHRFILNVTNSNLQIDHIDGNPLNNQKNNLRICNNKENSRNKNKTLRCNSGFKGVRYEKERKKFRASITVNYKSIFLGRFNKAIDAAKAYNKAALKYFGEFSKLNEIK